MQRNTMARDSYSYLHLPMVAGIVLVALALETTIAHVGDALHTVPAFALLGGVSIYLLGLVSVRLRHVHTVNWRRLVLAGVMLALIPVATNIPALATLAIVTAVLAAVIAYETRSYGEDRGLARHSDFAPERPVT
jgi:low temperature requirement protein LtrA